MRPHIRGRRRSLGQHKKFELCCIVARGASVEEAAADLDVSLRTVQREAKLDEDFDHELKLAQRATPDPLKIMHSAARAHWRAAAWLLERTDPENYAKRPLCSADPAKFEKALSLVLEAALEATPPERQTAVYAHVQAACDKAFEFTFPSYGQWGPSRRKALSRTPLSDDQRHRQYANDPSNYIGLFDEEAPTLEARLADQRREAAPTPPAVDAPCDHQAAVEAPDPACNGSPSATPPVAEQQIAEPEVAAPPEAAPVAKTPPAARRLPWPLRRRTAPSAPSMLPPAAASASLPAHRILSPKMRFATKLATEFAARCNLTTAHHNCRVPAPAGHAERSEESGRVAVATDDRLTSNRSGRGGDGNDASHGRRRSG